MRKFLPVAILLLVGFTAFSVFITQGEPPVAPQNNEQPGEGKALIGGDFTLTNQDGAVVRDADFRGRVMVVFFGFTNCPDICPVTAATYGRMLELLGEKANGVAPIFITVDPARDTPEVLKNYFVNIDSRIIALTGSPEDITKVAGVYKAYFSSATTEHDSHDGGEHGAHNVDHSGFVYVMDKNGEYVTHFAYDVPAETLVSQVETLLK